MDFSTFSKKAVAQDKRNRFGKHTGPQGIIPDALLPFYRECDPLDVEVELAEACVRFIPAAELESISEEFPYLLEQFIFATSNGDPIFLNEGHVYTCPHGGGQPKWELLADDFATYLSEIDEYFYLG